MSTQHAQYMYVLVLAVNSDQNFNFTELHALTQAAQSRRAAMSHANRSQALPLRFYFSSGRGESLGTRLQ